MIRLLGLPGSLRAGSTNHRLLEAVPSLDPALALTVYDGVGTLPHFSPDLDGEGQVLPAPVRALRELVRGADALIVSSPEYVHGIPGSLKNALDWLVSGDEVMDKPVLVWSASPSGAAFAHAQLLEVLGTMSTRLLADASLRITSARRAFDASGALIDAALRAELTASLAALRASLAVA